jgi:hypothetical protein
VTSYYLLPKDASRKNTQPEICHSQLPVMFLSVIGGFQQRFSRQTQQVLHIHRGCLKPHLPGWHANGEVPRSDEESDFQGLVHSQQALLTHKGMLKTSPFLAGMPRGKFL